MLDCGMSLARLLFVLSLAAVGCAAGSRRPDEPDGEPEPVPPSAIQRTGTMRFQVSEDSELYADAVKAAAAWSAVLPGCTITVSPDGDIPILLVQELDPGCIDEAAGGNPRGCSRVLSDVTDSWTQIPEWLHWSVRYGVILHEMGHHLRGPASPSHITDNPNAVMYFKRSLGTIELTPDDVAFILGGARLACAA